MRLTADLVQSSLSYLNPLHEREIDLRGHKIPALENLGLIRDHDAIDFTDNDIPVLANFPLSPRLQALYLGRNRISSIASGIAKNIPNLHTLVLTQNQFAELADLEPLTELVKLTHLSLLDNPVSRKEDYRYWIASRCPSIRFLDFQKVTDSERSKGAELFGTLREPTEAAQKILANRSVRSFNAAASTPTSTNGTTKSYAVKLNDQERLRFQNLINNAKSFADVDRLEKNFSEGKIPPGVLDGDAGTS